MSQITVENLTLAYSGVAVVRNLSFCVEKGDCLCVVGENGSGKSTLMKALLGLVTPASGTVTFGDGLKKGELGYLPQQTEIQRDFPASVKEVVMSGCVPTHKFLPFHTSECYKEAAEIMKTVGIDTIASKCYRNLSGGQQQRVLLARALCRADAMLLLDEPVTGLDPRAAENMYSIIKELNKKGLTVIMISHDIAEAVAVSSHILHLSVGGDFFGTTEEYLSSQLGRDYLNGGAK